MKSFLTLLLLSASTLTFGLGFTTSDTLLRCFTIQSVPDKILHLSYYVTGRNEDSVVLSVPYFSPLPIVYYA